MVGILQQRGKDNPHRAGPENLNNLSGYSRPVYVKSLNLDSTGISFFRRDRQDVLDKKNIRKSC